MAPREEDPRVNLDGEGSEPDPELEAMKKRVREMEAEAEKLKEFHEQNAAASAGGDEENAMEEDKEAVDARSVYVGNVDYGSSPEELQTHFAPCGTINRITILCDKWTGHSKGFAYIEFGEPSLVQQACLLNDSVFRGRQLKVTPKRTNVPGFNSRGRGRGRGRARGYMPYHRPRGRGRGVWRGS